MSDPGPLAPPPRRSHGCLWGCLIAAGIVAVLVLGGVGYVSWFLSNGFKNDESLRAAIVAMNDNATARAVLGDHIEIESVSKASIANALGGGKTEVVTALVKGSKGEGRIDTTLQTKDGRTAIVTLLLTLPDGRSYELTAPETRVPPDAI